MNPTEKRVNLRKQIRISIAIVVGFVLFCIAYFKFLASDEIIGVVHEGASVGTNPDLAWEVLLLNFQLRTRLWHRYDHTNEADREGAFKAIPLILDTVTPEQAEHIVSELLKRAPKSSTQDHKEKFLGALALLALKFKTNLRPLTQFSVFEIQLEGPFRKEANALLGKLQTQLGQSPLKYCLEGEGSGVKVCAKHILNKGEREIISTLVHYVKTLEPSEKKRELLLIMAHEKHPYPKEEIVSLLNSRNPMDVVTGLHLVREYNSREHLLALRNLSSSHISESVRSEVEKTIRYLSLSTP